MHKLIVTEKAQDDLDLIDRYSLEQFGNAVGSESMDGFLAVFARLKAYPESGPLYPDVSPTIRCITYRTHKLFYDFDGEVIVIRRVMHSAMNAAQILN
ncbi:hypothetical protein BH09PSE3_BH09PSE3_07980 [soil metagenome]